MTTPRIPERLWNECPIQGSTFYIIIPIGGNTQTNANIAYRGNAANVRCSVLNGESADLAEDIVVGWSQRFPRSATPRKPFSVWTILLCIAVSGVHMLYNSQVPRGRPSLLYDHTNVILRVVVKEGFYCTLN